ncbi:neuroligin-1, partial [Nilaparvata lugens]|uniref:neuroligin-1 n=1 Tax=Nilaparvata lugens TaxID=108931 RepID=UPI00193DB80E
LAVKRRVAEQTGCHGDLVDDDLAPCLRGKSLAELLRVRLEPPRFLPGFAPFVDGAVLPVALGAGGAGGALALADLAQARHGGPGYELADFPERDLLFGLTTTESYLDLSAQDLEFGFDETRRDRILRTYVRNAYYFHLNEIFSTLKNEYTDWERPAGNPLGVRDATLEVLSDGHTTAPLLRVGYLHSVRGGRTYFMHFRHQSTQTDYPQRAGSVRGEDVPYVLGLPLVGGQPFFPHNYSTQDAALSTQLIHYLANFVRKGDPNGPASPRQGAPHSGPPHSGNLHSGSPHPSADPSSTSNHESPFWDTYDSINQLYLEMGVKPEVRNHYRGHKMSLWLNLIPQLHQPGIAELSMRHHHFQEEGAQYYDGSVRPQSLQRPSLPTAATLTTSTETPTTTGAASTPAAAAAPTSTTECPPNATAPLAPAADTVRPANSHNLLRKLANSHYQSYTTALTVTIAVGCFLLLLNILIFAGIYHQRDRAAAHSKHKKKKDEMMELNSCSSGSGDMELKQALADSQMSVSAAGGSTIVELPLQEFKSSPPPGGGGLKGAGGGDLPPGYCSGGDLLPVTSPSIPEPPPPPKAQPPNASILRQQHMAGCPQTPSSMKKRVQIQEISV